MSWRQTRWRSRFALALAAALMLSAAARAQEAEVPGQPVQPPTLPETVVEARPGTFPAEPLPSDTVYSPNRQPTPANQTGSSVTVITEEQINQVSPRGGQTTVAEVLRGQLGVDIVRQGGPGGVTSLFLRGANSQQTKVLLDGMPLNDPSNAGRSFITKRGQGPMQIRAGTFGGTFNTGQASLNVSGGDDRKYYSFTGSYYNTGGISAAAASNGNTEHDPFKIGTGSGRMGYDLGDNWNVDYVFRYIDSSASIDDFDFVTGLPVDNLIRKNLLKNWSNRIQLSNFSSDGVFYQRFGFNLIDYDRFDTDSGPFSPPRFHGQTRMLDYFASYKLTDTNTLSGGADYLHEDASSTFNPQVNQQVKGAYLQDAVNWGNFFGTAGARWDNTSRAGPAQTYKITGLYNILPTASALHSTIGTGFRQPALAENLFQFGNPNLRPEFSKGWDVGLRQTIWEGVVVADATYFRNDFTNLIIFDFNTFSLQNVGQSRSSGVELSLFVQVAQNLAVNTFYTHDDTLNLDTGTQLLRRPRDKVNFSVTQAIPQWGSSVTLNMLNVGSRLDTGNSRLAPYTLVNLALNSQLTPAVGGVLRLDNITNTSYQEVRGFGTPGFGMYGGLNVVY
jgi:vitamin B12 transporter